MDDEQLQALQKQARDILEKRTFERFRTQLQVRIKVLDAGQAEALTQDINYAATTSEKGRTRETKHLFKVMTQDVSQGGLRVVCPDPVSIGAQVQVEMHLPEIPLPITALAEVVWVSDNDEQGGNAGVTCGLRFSKINRPDLSKLERFLLLQQGR